MIQMSNEFEKKSDNENYFGVKGNFAVLMYLSMRDKDLI